MPRGDREAMVVVALASKASATTSGASSGVTPSARNCETPKPPGWIDYPVKGGKGAGAKGGGGKGGARAAAVQLAETQLEQQVAEAAIRQHRAQQQQAAAAAATTPVQLSAAQAAQAFVQLLGAGAPGAGALGAGATITGAASGASQEEQLTRMFRDAGFAGSVSIQDSSDDSQVTQAQVPLHTRLSSIMPCICTLGTHTSIGAESPCTALEPGVLAVVPSSNTQVTTSTLASTIIKAH
jgi:hypothetical protein